MLYRDKAWLEREYVDNQKGIYEMGKMANCDPKTVWKWLKRYNIPTRPRGHNRDKNLWNGRPKGYKHTPETIEKIRQDTIKKGKVPYLKNGKHWLSNANPEDNPNWKGGITPERQAFYHSDEWKEADKQVRQRDKVCQNCQEKRGSRKLHIHHVAGFYDYPELRCKLSNLVLLCHKCHMWVHSSKNINDKFIIRSANNE